MNHSEDREFAVNRQALSAFFTPPIARSTFYYLVKRGRIIPLNEPRGYFRLNASLKRLGMPTVDRLPSAKGGHVESRPVQIVILVLSMLLGSEFPRISSADLDSITMGEVAEIKRLFAAYEVELDTLKIFQERAPFAEGVIAAAKAVAAAGG